MKTVNYVLNGPLSKKYKIALLLDIHCKVSPYILPMLQSNNPDMICIAGDLCNTSLSESPKIKEFLREIVGISPTFFSFGNHDYLLNRQDIEIKKIRITVLNDSFIRFNEEIVIGGMTSYFYHNTRSTIQRFQLYFFQRLRGLMSLRTKKYTKSC